MSATARPRDRARRAWAISDVNEAQHLSRNIQMTGGRNRQEFGDAFDDAHDDGFEGEEVHAGKIIDCDFQRPGFAGNGEPVTARA